MYPACRAREATAGVVACRTGWRVQRSVMVTWAADGSDVIVTGPGPLRRTVAQLTRVRLPAITRATRQWERRRIALLLIGNDAARGWGILVSICWRNSIFTVR